MGLRGFYAYTDKLEPAKIILDRYGKFTLANYDQSLVCDIDSDGENEFITRLGYGFGQYFITFSVWKYSHSQKQLELAYRTQYEQLQTIDMFLRKNGSHVEVVAGYWNNGESVITQSYGYLQIKNGILVPENEQIPFRRITETK